MAVTSMYLPSGWAFQAIYDFHEIEPAQPAHRNDFIFLESQFFLAIDQEWALLSSAISAICQSASFLGSASA